MIIFYSVGSKYSFQNACIFSSKYTECVQHLQFSSSTLLPTLGVLVSNYFILLQLLLNISYKLKLYTTNPWHLKNKPFIYINRTTTYNSKALFKELYEDIFFTIIFNCKAVTSIKDIQSFSGTHFNQKFTIKDILYSE